MKKIYLILLITLTGCISTIPEKPELISGDLQCTDYGMMEYCEGTSETNMSCYCIHHNDFADPTDFLRR